MSRLIIGLGIGLSSSTVPTYLSELGTRPAAGRDGLAEPDLHRVGHPDRVLVSYGLGPSANWRAMFAGALIPALVLLVGLVVLPETRAGWVRTAGRTRPGRC